MHPIEQQDSACTIRPHDAAQLEGNQDALSVLWWTNAVCLPAIATLGLCCNALNLLVLACNESARRMPSSHLLLSLAVFDSLFLLFAVLELTPVSALPAQQELVAVHTRMVLFVRMFASTFYKTSILIVVAFNVERYLCVCRPLWAHRAGIVGVGSTAKSRSIVALSLAISLVCSVQWPLAWTVVDCWDAEAAHGYAVVTMRESQQLQSYYRLMDWLSLVAFNLLPIALLCVLNCQLVATLRRIVRRDSSTSATFSTSTTTAAEVEDGQHPQAMGVISANTEVEGQQQRLNANAMLFAVVLLLFVCIGPQAPARLLYEWYGHYHVGAVLYTCISQQLVFLNASLNFCLYCLVSHRYRSLLRDSLRRLFHSDLCFSCCLGRPRFSRMAVKFSQNSNNNGNRVQQQQRPNNNIHSSSSIAAEDECQMQPFLQLELCRPSTPLTNDG